MQVIRGPLDGLLVIEPRVHRDVRGCFLEAWHRERYAEIGLPAAFVQDNVSTSRRAVLRGLHYQVGRPQGKLVSVVQGEIFDVAVDIRPGSPSFGRWFGVCLSSETGRQLYVPEGFAHGFLVLSETAVVYYKCTAAYMPEGDRSIRWNDAAIGVEWPLPDPILSDKDRTAPLLCEAEIG